MSSNSGKPKLLIVTDGQIHVGITAVSIEDLEQNAKTELHYLKDTKVTMVREDQSFVETVLQFEVLSDNETLKIIPDPDMEFSVEQEVPERLVNKLC